MKHKHKRKRNGMYFSQSDQSNETKRKSCLKNKLLADWIAKTNIEHDEELSLAYQSKILSNNKNSK